MRNILFTTRQSVLYLVLVISPLYANGENNLTNINSLSMKDMGKNQSPSNKEMQKVAKDLRRILSPPGIARPNSTTQNVKRIFCEGFADDTTSIFGYDHMLRGGRPAPAAELTAVMRRNRRFIIAITSWKKNTITWTVTDFSDSLSKDTTLRLLRKAFSIWGAVVPLTFQEVAPAPHLGTENADIIISFVSVSHGDGYDFEPDSGAHAFRPGEGLGGDIHFRNDLLWAASYTEPGVHFLYAAVHEIGHSLGLKHTDVSGSIMLPEMGEVLTDDITLGQDDIDGIAYIYGRRYDNKAIPQARKPLEAVFDFTTSATVRNPTSSPFMRRPSLTSAEYGYERCASKYDAIAVIRSEVTSFKGKLMWRIKRNGSPAYSRPVEISRFFSGLPPADTWKNIDEVFEHANHDIVFFIGKRYFLFDGTKLKSGFPSSGMPITDYGLPGYVNKVDAVFRWGPNKEVFIVSGSQYWKYLESKDELSPGYPHQMSTWRGVRLPVDAAFQTSEGKTYFFHNNLYWESDGQKMKVEKRARMASTYWFHCSSKS